MGAESRPKSIVGKMKIGILTFHFAKNYGAVLQCYALQEFLNSRGHRATVVDYRPKSLANGYKWLDIRRFWGKTPAKFIRKTRCELSVIGDRKRRYAAFDRFSCKYLKTSGMEDDYDLVIVGSDQVWNTALTGGFDPVYWGEKYKGCISYAASGEESLLKQDPRKIASRLDNFKGISVRESSTAFLLQSYYKKNTIHTCCDPVFLQEPSFWTELASKSGITDDLGNYLLLYQTRYSDKAMAEAENICKEKNLRLICLSAKVEKTNSPEIICASPEDFLALVANAVEVVTTSFHCTAFARIFGKECHSIRIGDGNDSRITDLLNSDNDGREESIAYLNKFGI